MNLSATFRQMAQPIWEAQEAHPFLRGLADGTLASSAFEIWLRQDYLFHRDFARVLALGGARSPDSESMRWMIALAHGVLHQEILLHHAYAIELGISEEDLEAGTRRPTTQAYADHLLRVAGLGSYVELIGAILPRLVGRTEIARQLNRAPTALRYYRWIESYSGSRMQRLGAEGQKQLDHLGDAASTAERDRAAAAFLLSSRYEWMFWQQCVDGQDWPL